MPMEKNGKKKPYTKANQAKVVKAKAKGKKKKPMKSGYA